MLAKPFEPHMVIALVRQLLGDQPRAQAEPATVSVTGAADGYPFEPGSGAGATTSLDEYLDRLDEALADAPVPPARLDTDDTRERGDASLPDVSAEGVGDAELADAFSTLSWLTSLENGPWPRPPPRHRLEGRS